QCPAIPINNYHCHRHFGLPFTASVFLDIRINVLTALAQSYAIHLICTDKRWSCRPDKQDLLWESEAPGLATKHRPTRRLRAYSRPCANQEVVANPTGPFSLRKPHRQESRWHADMRTPGGGHEHQDEGMPKQAITA